MGGEHRPDAAGWYTFAYGCHSVACRIQSGGSSEPRWVAAVVGRQSEVEVCRVTEVDLADQDRRAVFEGLAVRLLLLKPIRL